MSELALILFVIVALQVATLACVGLPMVMRRRAPVEAQAVDVLVPESEDIEPTDLRALRHHHRFEGKDADGIRHCRCGARYLDGARV